jgi:membrane-associated protease RseP (regulator of RpoE activity)
MAAELPESSFIRRLHDRGLLLPIVVGLVVIGVLAQGFLTREGGGDVEEPKPYAIPSPTSTPFRPELEKIPLTYFSDYWLQLGERAHHLLVDLGEAQVTGVRVSRGYALSSIAAADAVTVAPGEVPEGQLVAVDGREGAALFRLPADVGAAPFPTATALHAGAWLAAVTVDEEHGLKVTPGHLTSSPLSGAPLLDVAIAFPASLDVAAIVDLDARLAGVALRSPDGVRVVSAEAAGSLVARLASNPACRAVDVAPLSDPVRKAMRLTGGVAVEQVAVGAFASPPDLRPGDVLLQLGNKSLSTPEEFVEAWDSQEPGSRARFLVARGGRRLVRRAEVPGRDCRPDSATPRELPLLGAVVQWTAGGRAPRPADAGFRLLHIPEGTPAAAAGLEAGDVLVAVDGTPLAWPDARRLLATWKSRHVPVLTVHHGEAARLLVLPEEPEQ